MRVKWQEPANCNGSPIQTYQVTPNLWGTSLKKKRIFKNVLLLFFFLSSDITNFSSINLKNP